MTDLNDNYNDNTMLNDWWPIVKSNFAKVEEELNKSITSDRLADGVVTAAKLASDVTSMINAKADKQTVNGGFAGGDASFSGDDTSGVVIGHSATNAGAGGAAVGSEANVTGNGAAVGYHASAKGGGAIGSSATADNGFAGGMKASAGYGCAAGRNAVTKNGVAVGNDAKTQDAQGRAIDAIQLGTGTNNAEKTLQVYDYTLMNADGTIPSERLQTANGGFAGGSSANAGRDGAAIGQGAYAYRGGAVGYGTATGNGFAGGYNAKTQADGISIDAIQLGTGTNIKERTLQVYDYTLMDEDGTIPHERFPAYSKTPVRIGTWINGMSVWRVVIDVKLTEDDIQKGYYKLKSKDDLDDGALTIVNATLRTYRDVGWAVDSCPATLGDDFYVEFDNSQPTYNHLQGVIEYVHT